MSLPTFGLSGCGRWGTWDSEDLRIGSSWRHLLRLDGPGYDLVDH